MIDYSPVVRWYGDKLPKNFSDFISWQINSRVIPNAVSGYEINILLTTDLTPHAKLNDFSHQYEIFMPVALFTPEFYDAFDVPYYDRLFAAIAMYNGFMLHEATHAKIFTEMEKRINTSAHKIAQNFASNNNLKENLFHYCANLIEDLYILEYDKIKYPNIVDFQHITYQLISNPNLLDKIVNEGNAQNDLIVQTLFNWRDETLRNHKAFNTGNIAPFKPILEKVNIGLLFDDRLKLAKEIYDLLPDENGKQQGQEGYDSNSQNKTHQIGEPNQDDTSIGDKVDELEESKKRQILGQIAKTHKEIENKEKTKFFQINDAFNPDNIKVSYKYVTDITRSGVYTRNFKRDNKWVLLANVLRMKGQQKKKIAMPQKNGVEIMSDELYRVGTDEKVFGIRNSFEVAKKKPEVILLLDCSGSMSGLIETLADEAYSFIRVLEEQGFNISVFGHTSEFGGDYNTYAEDCLVFGIYSNIINITGGKAKVSLQDALSIVANTGGMRENADGIAIKYVGEKFSKTNSPKFLVVMSDGRPSCEQYYSDDAITHTKQSADKLRSKGIKVLSVSLVDSVVRTNNKIYGEKNNVTSDNIQGQFQKLINILNT